MAAYCKVEVLFIRALRKLSIVEYFGNLHYVPRNEQTENENKLLKPSFTPAQPKITTKETQIAAQSPCKCPKNGMKYAIFPFSRIRVNGARGRSQ